MEHRVGQRKPVRLDVTLSGRYSSAVQGEILNLSARGAFIRLLGDYSKLRNIIRLRIPIPTEESGYCECWALIVRNAADGIGVMFDHIQDFPFEQLAAPSQPQRIKTRGAETSITAESAAQLESATQ